MTKDEIGKLTLSAIRSDNTLRAIGASQIGGPADLMAAPIARLLEERERLLEALDEAEEAHGGECVGVDKCHMRQRMQAALTFATAPAGKEEPKACGFVIAEDRGAPWTCGQPAGHAGKHSGQ